MSKVYVVQRPAYFDRVKRGWVNKYDLTPATEHGELMFMLRPGNIFKDKIYEATKRLEECLADFTVDDYILAVGDPIAIGIAVMVASSKTGGFVSMLKFDRHANNYQPYELKLSSYQV